MIGMRAVAVRARRMGSVDLNMTAASDHVMRLVDRVERGEVVVFHDGLVLRTFGSEADQRHAVLLAAFWAAFHIAA